MVVFVWWLYCCVCVCACVCVRACVYACVRLITFVLPYCGQFAVFIAANEKHPAGRSSYGAVEVKPAASEYIVFSLFIEK